jgi:hypothetical protein
LAAPTTQKIYAGARLRQNKYAGRPSKNRTMAAARF